MRCLLLIAPLAWALLGPVAAVRAAQPERLTWAGLVPGPLAPAEAERLERALLGALLAEPSLRLVDAGGTALDPRLDAEARATVEARRDQGVDAFLRFEHDVAEARLEEAVRLFETRLLHSDGHALLHDALLARAESEFAAGRRASARSTLSQLAALRPKQLPSRATHPAPFVALWEKTVAELGAVGRIAITASEPGCEVSVDGQALGQAPIDATRIPPGRHFVVGRWIDGARIEAVQVEPGQEARVQLRRASPADAARRALREAVAARLGVEAAADAAVELPPLSQSSGVLMGALRKDPAGRPHLLLARLARDGSVAAVVRTRVADEQAPMEQLRRAIRALLEAPQGGELELTTEGAAIARAGLAMLLFGGLPRALEPAGSAEGFVWPGDAPPPVVPPLALTSRWWFWALIASAVAGAAAGAALALREEPDRTRFEVSFP
jgi:hypothetical protein